MKNLNLGELFQTHRSALFDAREASEGERIEPARIDLDALSAAELQKLATIRARFASQSSASDHLRLPRIADISEQEISSAVARIASMTSPPISKTEPAIAREQSMRAMLANIAEMMTTIQRKPNRTV